MQSVTSVQNMSHKDLQEKCKIMYANLFPHIYLYRYLNLNE